MMMMMSHLMMMFQCTSVYMSTMSLTAVAVDRCMSVSTSPVPYNRSSRIF